MVKCIQNVYQNSCPVFTQVMYTALHLGKVKSDQSSALAL